MVLEGAARQGMRALLGAGKDKERVLYLSLHKARSPAGSLALAS